MEYQIPKLLPNDGTGKMVIRDWFKKWKKQGDGYDPDGKTEQDGREHSARFEIRGAVLAEPLTDATRKTRRSLLAYRFLPSSSMLVCQSKNFRTLVNDWARSLLLRYLV